MSPALSLTALPGDGGIRTRLVALLAADGVHGASLISLHAALSAAGAEPCVIAPRIGPVATSDGRPLQALGSFENASPVLFDALVLPDGAAGVAVLAGLVAAMEFVAHQYRHGKSILALGASSALLEQAHILATLPNGEPDPGLLWAGERAGDLSDTAAAFVAAVGRHRHPAREAQPPRV